LDPTVPVFSPAYNTSPKLFVAILRALEASRARPRFKDAYKAAARIGEERAEATHRKVHLAGQRSKLTGV
jgi:hypothetical protein